MPDIASPLNFVPLSEKVFRPQWSASLSHDVPFEGSLSGSLTVQISAKRRLFVRGGSPKLSQEQLGRIINNTASQDEQMAFNDWVTSARTSKGDFCLPGTTVKGAIRNVLKTIAFGKMNAVDNRRFAYREVASRSHYLKIFVENKNGLVTCRSQSGWLKKDKDGQWWILPCSCQRVEHDHLIEYGFAQNPNGKAPKFRVGGKNPLTAAEKYQEWTQSGASRTITCQIGEIKPQVGRHRRLGWLKLVYGLAAEIGKGKTDVTLVCTGEAGEKHMEFLFHAPAATHTCLEQEPSQAGGWLPISERVKEGFEFVYNEDSEGWGALKGDFLAGRAVPIFWLGSSDRVDYFGLAQLFPIPSERSLHDGIPKSHSHPESDLAEVLFGRADDAEEIKGRVDCGQFVSHDARECEVYWATAGSPKPSFYANYLQQKRNISAGGYATHMSEQEVYRLRGWKRYYPRKDGESYSGKKSDRARSASTDTAFRPLKEGATFEGKIHFHNLRKEELGALLWALDFGGLMDGRHSLGYGKGFGFGSVVMSLKGADVVVNDVDYQELNKEGLCHLGLVEMFTSLMSDQIAGWKESQQLKAFFGLISESLQPARAGLEYPDFEQKEFRQAIEDKAALLPPNSVSDFLDQDADVSPSLSSQNDWVVERPAQGDVAAGADPEILAREREEAQELQRAAQANMQKEGAVVEGQLRLKESNGKDEFGDKIVKQRWKLEVGDKLFIVPAPSVKEFAITSENDGELWSGSLGGIAPNWTVKLKGKAGGV